MRDLEATIATLVGLGLTVVVRDTGSGGWTYTSGCELLTSVTSAGSITSLGTRPDFVVIEDAWRDEGTSGHYLPASEWAHLYPTIAGALETAFDDMDEPRPPRGSWTTDAPCRETEAAIASAAAAGLHAVEMEAAALHAYARATSSRVVCIAHVTNSMAVDGDDFEKGEGSRRRSRAQPGTRLWCCRWRWHCRTPPRSPAVAVVTQSLVELVGMVTYVRVIPKLIPVHSADQQRVEESS